MCHLKCKSFWKRAAALLTALALMLTVFSAVDLSPRVKAESYTREYTAKKYIDPIEGVDCGIAYGGNAVTATGGAPAGENYVYTRTPDTWGSYNLERGLPAKNFSAYADGYLHLWFYVDSAEALRTNPGNAWIDLSSGAYQQGYNWDLKQYVKNDGWNEVYLPFSEAGIYDCADLSSIVYFRALINQSQSSIFAIDDVYVCREAKTYDEIRVVDDTEGLNGWTNAQHIIGGAPAGEGYVLFNGAPDYFNNKVLSRTFGKLNIAPYTANGYFHLYVYVDNADTAQSLTLDLSVNGFVNNIEWNLSAYLYQNGWNELYLPFNKASGVGTLDAGQISDIRVYVNNDQTSILAVDDLYVCKEKKDAVTYGAEKDLGKVHEGTTQWMTWNGADHPFLAAQNAEPAVPGTYYVESAGADQFGSIVLEHHFNAKRSYLGYENGYLHVRVYVDKLHGIGDGFIQDQILQIADTWQLGSYLTWNLQNYLYQDGWNELYLPVASPDASQGVLALDNVGYLRCYAKTSCTSKLRLSDIYFCKAGNDGPVDADPENVGAQMWVDRVEAATTGWYTWNGSNMLNAAVVSQGAPEGNNYISSNTPDSFDNVTLNYTLPEAKNFAGYENGWLHLWIYVVDYAAASTSPLTVDIANETDILSNLYHWDAGKYLYQSGWNELYLPLSEAARTGSFDLSRLAFVRAYIPRSISATLALDDIYFCREGNEPPAEQPVEPTDPTDPSVSTDPSTPTDPSVPTDPVIPDKRPENPGAEKWVDHVESADTGWYTWEGINVLPATMVNNGAPVGERFMQSTTTDSFGSLTLNYRLPNTMNITGYEEGYLHLWVYVDALAKVKGSTSSVDITPDASMTPESPCFSWHLADYLYQDGWNELFLPMDEALDSNGGIDASIEFMRVYTTGGVSTKLGLDDIYFCREGGEPPVEEDNGGGNDDKPLTYGAKKWLDHVETTAGWYLDTNPYVVKEGAPDGSAYLETVTADAWGSLTFAHAWDTPMDLSRYDVENGYLHIWVYVENAAGLTNGYIELTSSGGADKEEINWSLSGLLKEGWNELYLPLFDAGMEGGYFDGSHVNFFRIFAQGVTKLGIDDICVCLSGVDEVPNTGDTAPAVQMSFLVAASALAMVLCCYALVSGKKRYVK